MGRTVVRYRREVVGAVTKFLGVAAPTLQPAETATSATTRLTGIMRFRFVVRGKAGSGKTTLLQWLAMRVARSEQDSPWPWSRPAVPFFIRLRERVDKGFPAPEEFVKLLVPAIAGGMPDGWSIVCSTRAGLWYWWMGWMRYHKRSESTCCAACRSWSRPTRRPATW